jgi:hypothetical protein
VASANDDRAERRVVLEATFERLKAKHKRLNAACIAGSSPACHERRATYEEAMKIKKQIEKLR